jgi:thioester reductase-like protein
MIKKVVLITGASGLIGSHLSKLLDESNFEVIHLVRKKNLSSKYQQFTWSLEDNYIDIEALKKNRCNCSFGRCWNR